MKDATKELKKIEFSKNKLISYIGNIGEIITEQILMKEGYEVCKWKPYSAGDSLPEPLVKHNLRLSMERLSHKHKPDESVIVNGQTVHLTYEYDDNSEIERDLKEFFGEKFKDFKKYVGNLGLFKEAGNVIYSPDLVAKKENQIYVIEVKTNSGKLTEKKREGLVSAKRFGFVPVIVNIDVDIVATNFKMQEL